MTWLALLLLLWATPAWAIDTHTHETPAEGGTLHDDAMPDSQVHKNRTDTHGTTSALCGRDDTCTFTALTLGSPSISDFTNANHAHTGTPSGGDLAFYIRTDGQNPPTTAIPWGNQNLESVAELFIGADDENDAVGAEIIHAKHTGTGASNLFGVFVGNTGTGTNFDEAFWSFYLLDEENTREEVARLTWEVNDIDDDAVSGIDGEFRFAVKVLNVLTDVLTLNETGAQVHTRAGVGVAPDSTNMLKLAQTVTSTATVEEGIDAAWTLSPSSARTALYRGVKSVITTGNTSNLNAGSFGTGGNAAVYGEFITAQDHEVRTATGIEGRVTLSDGSAVSGLASVQAANMIVTITSDDAANWNIVRGMTMFVGLEGNEVTVTNLDGSFQGINLIGSSNPTRTIGDMAIARYALVGFIGESNTTITNAVLVQIDGDLAGPTYTNTPEQIRLVSPNTTTISIRQQDGSSNSENRFESDTKFGADSVPATAVDVTGVISSDSTILVDVGTGSGGIRVDGSTGGCVMFRDTDDMGWTELLFLNGVITSTIDADGVCDGA